VTAGEDHHVDRRRAAQHFSAHGLDPAAVQVGLGLGVVAPVEHAARVRAAEAERNVDPRMAVAAAGFEQQHRGSAGLGQPVGQHAAGRAGTDDDVVMSLHTIST